MYSPYIEKQCRQCVYAQKAVGVADYMHCDVYGGYFRCIHSCENFKYDILKKTLHRRTSIQPNSFTANDFLIE